MVIGNARSINNKVEELKANTLFLNEYREAGVICITETWLNKDIPDECVDIDGFSVFRSDRTENSGKTCGGGVCAYINNRWCAKHNVHVTNQLCTPNFELLSLSLRPKYLPREFPKIMFNTVYIPQTADVKTTAIEVANIVHDQQTKSPDCVVFVTGDFNHYVLDKTLPTFYQYIDCKTRENNTLDLFYGNVKNGFCSRQLPPLGASDHNMIHLIPKYRSVLKTNAVENKTINVWNEKNIEALKGCFDCTIWDVFKTDFDNVNIDEINDIVCEYVKFCENNVCEKKVIKLFPNSKPWVNKDLKDIIKQKKNSFITDSREKQKEIIKLTKKKIKQCKVNYGKKIENLFKSNNIKQTWDHLKAVAGCKKQKTNIVINQDPNDYVNNLNNFYARFDQYDFSKEGENIVNNMLNESLTDHFVINELEVERVFSELSVRKACGPDGMKGIVLKNCASQLCYIFSYIFNLSLNVHKIPSIWKTSEIIPVPKRPLIKELNDLRPVALTSLIIKCFEKIIVKEIKKCLSNCQDQMQFAYREKRGVDDAVLTFLDNIYKHLDTPRNYCRILFVDFSSAFNTLQPHLIIKTLNEMNIDTNIIVWIYEFLTKRSQYVKIDEMTVNHLNGNCVNHKNVISKCIITNTGAPQGTVLSPILFTAYTNDCQLHYSTQTKMIKFADDTTIQGLIYKNNNENEYRDNIKWFVDWCSQHFLVLNVNKTKELIIDFRIKKSPISPLFINNEEVETVHSYKYLGITVDSKLNWEEHSNNVVKKLSSRLYFLRKINYFHVDAKISEIFYKSFLESLILFALTCWGGNIKTIQKEKIDRIIIKANKIIYKTFTLSNVSDFNCLFNLNCQKKMLSILKDQSHPLFEQIIFSKRSGRPLFLKCNTNRYKSSFLPYSLKLL